MKYWDKAWSLVEGCTPVSPACENCWLAGMAHRFHRHTFDGKLTDDKGVFNGTVITHTGRLDIPLKRKKPTVYALWSDLFHEKVPDEFIYKAITVMIQPIDGWGSGKKIDRHTFLLLTKRPERMAKFIAKIKGYRFGTLDGGPWKIEGIKQPLSPVPSYRDCRIKEHPDNIWLGTTAENQEQADKRIPILLQIPGKKFLSIEPMLRPVDLKEYLSPEDYSDALCEACEKFDDDNDRCSERLNWVIVGGESGRNARPTHMDYVRSIRDQCQAAGVPFFFKQWGNYKGPNDWTIPPGRLLDGREWNEVPFYLKKTDTKPLTPAKKSIIGQI